MGEKILLVDDNNIMRDVLRHFLEKQPGMEVVAEAENSRTAIKLTCKFRPDVIVMDIIMPDLNSIDATRQIVEEFLPLPFFGLLITSHLMIFPTSACMVK
jgi:NarL family two-component system response regulator LiaR